jgi:NADH-quinone oxidoreductase subunit M
MFLSVIASWGIAKNVRAYFALLLILETGVLGTFFATDLFLLYVFYEIMLIPMYFLIGLWGGGRRKYAAMKFVLYTLVGSVFILVAIIGLYFTNVRDFVDTNTVDDRAAERMKENPQLPVLQRAGQAAMLRLNGHGQLLAARDAGGDGKVELLGRGVKPNDALERMSQQPFFQETYQYLLFLLLFLGFARLWRIRGHGPVRLQAPACVFVRQPHGLCDSRFRDLVRRREVAVLGLGHERRHVPDAGPRHQLGRHVLRGRRRLRTRAPP